MMAGPIRLPLVATGPRGAARPAFARIAILGLDEVGGSVGLAIRQAWPSALVIGVDRSDVLELAVRMHAVDVGADDPFIAADAELIVLAGDPSEQAPWMAALPDIVPGPSLVTGVQAFPGRAALSAAWPARLLLVEGQACVSCSGGGLAAGRADFFVGHRWDVTPSPALAARGAIEPFCAFVRALGADPVVGTGITS
ncbi:MAG: hypothetical protein NTY02_11970 [Acidobacteria bacterium]|nr:hypothetical protein [Acidobacteriota bacterium]